MRRINSPLVRASSPRDKKEIRSALADDRLLIEALDRRAESLRSIGPARWSEFPHTNELFLQKMQGELEMEHRLAERQEDFQFVQDELRRLENNADILDRGIGSVVGSAPRESLSEGQRKLLEECDRTRSLSESLGSLIPRMERSLAGSRAVTPPETTQTDLSPDPFGVPPMRFKSLSVPPAPPKSPIPSVPFPKNPKTQFLTFDLTGESAEHLVDPYVSQESAQAGSTLTHWFGPDENSDDPPIHQTLDGVVAPKGYFLDCLYDLPSMDPLGECDL